MLADKIHCNKCLKDDINIYTEYGINECSRCGNIDISYIERAIEVPIELVTRKCDSVLVDNLIDSLMIYGFTVGRRIPLDLLREIINKSKS